MLKSIGRKLLSGKFNLTTVSFPIKCMCAKSTLETIGSLQGVNPVYLNAAALTSDPIERMIFVMTAAISYFYPTHIFEKPVRFFQNNYCAAESHSRRDLPVGGGGRHKDLCGTDRASAPDFTFLVRGTAGVISNVRVEFVRS